MSRLLHSVTKSRHLFVGSTSDSFENNVLMKIMVNVFFSEAADCN